VRTPSKRIEGGDSGPPLQRKRLAISTVSICIQDIGRESPLSRRNARKPGVSDGDARLLRECILHIGGSEDEPFKEDLIRALEKAYDMDRINRITALIRRMSEVEILALCELD
jgi:hypothetical protein